MAIRTIPYSKTGYFSKLMCDYLAEDASLNDFYGRFPKLENFKKQLEEKQSSFKSKSRKVLVRSLQKAV